MTIKLVDVFDRNFIAACYDDVADVFAGIIYFNDGSIEEFDTRYYDWEEVEK